MPPQPCRIRRALEMSRLSEVCFKRCVPIRCSVVSLGALGVVRYTSTSCSARVRKRLPPAAFRHLSRTSTRWGCLFVSLFTHEHEFVDQPGEAADHRADGRGRFIAARRRRRLARARRARTLMEHHRTDGRSRRVVHRRPPARSAAPDHGYDYSRVFVARADAAAMRRSRQSSPSSTALVVSSPARRADELGSH